MTKKKVSCPNKYHIEKLSNYVDLCFVDQNVLQRRRTKAKMVVEADEDLVEEEEEEVTMTRISGLAKDCNQFGLSVISGLTYLMAAATLRSLQSVRLPMVGRQPNQYPGQRGAVRGEEGIERSPGS